MPIVTNRIIGRIDRPGGLKKRHEEHVDHLGKIWPRRYTIDPLLRIAFAGLDENQNLIDYAAFLDTADGILLKEKNRIEAWCEGGGDPEDKINGRSAYLNPDQRNRTIISAIMDSREPPEELIKGCEYIAALTNAQIDALFTVAERNRIRTRTNGIIDQKQFFEDDKNRIEKI